MAALRPMARAYIAAVVVAAVVVVAVAAWSFRANHLPVEPLLVLTPIYLLALKLPARLSNHVFLLVNMPVLIAAYLIGGWQTAALVAASGVVFTVWRPGQTQPFNATNFVFNTAQFVLAGVMGGLVYQAVGGARAVDLANGFSEGALLPVVLSALAVIATNLALMLPILQLAEGASARSVWRPMVVSSAFPYLAYGLFGLLMAVLWTVGSGFAASLILIPLLVARWGFQQYAEQREAYEATIRSLVQAVETKDHYTRGHSERVAAAAVRIAEVIGMREDRMKTLGYAGILHDVGKLGVRTSILQKTGMLDDEEFAEIQRHPVFATEIVRGIEFLAEAHAGILHHHERLDGLGYPLGLKGNDIPEFARIIAVADAFDSMTSTRSYRGARSVPEAVAELHRCEGTQFDAEMVHALVTSLSHRPWRAVRPDEVRQVDLPLTDIVVEGFDHDDPSVPYPLGHDPAIAAAAEAAEAAEEAALRGGDES